MWAVLLAAASLSRWRYNGIGLAIRLHRLGVGKVLGCGGPGIGIGPGTVRDTGPCACSEGYRPLCMR